MGIKALCRHSPICRFIRNILTGPALPGSRHFSDTETGAEARFLGVLESLVPLN